MTIGELIKALNIYGGGYMVEATEQMISTINLALREFYLSHAVTKTASFNVSDRRPAVSYKNMICRSGETLIIPISGIAYSMRVSGKGDYVLQYGNKTEALQFDTGNEIKVIKGFFSGNGTVRFFSDFSFIVHDLSIYDQLFGREVSSIPDGSPITEIDLREAYPDFLALIAPLTDSQGRIIEDCRVQDGRITLSSSFCGEVFITYRRLPNTINYYYDIDEINESDTVDISEEYAIPLILLIWYCYWYHTDETKAKIYKERYDAVMADLASARFSLDRKYIIEDGWS